VQGNYPRQRAIAATHLLAVNFGERTVGLFLAVGSDRFGFVLPFRGGVPSLQRVV
jgi:hypothetical protein